MGHRKGQPLQFDLDDDDLKLFCDEAQEQIELLDRTLVQLEAGPEPELLQQIFRAAHTLKGSSATIGHTKMASLTHAMETVLDALRQGDNSPAPAVVDALLAGLDALRLLANEVATRQDSGVETSALEARILATLDQPDAVAPSLTTGRAAGALSPDEMREALAALERSTPVYVVEVAVDKRCQLPSIRCYQALQELESLGTVIALWPGRDAVEAGGAGYALRGVVASAASEEQVSAALLAISDVPRVGVRSVAAGELGGVILGDDASGKDRDRPPLAVIDDAPGPDVSRTPRKTSQSVRIDVDRLDGLMNLVGELVIDRTRLQKIREQLSVVIKDHSLAGLTENFEQTTAHLARVTDELQEEIMRSRMLPVRAVLTRLPRLVRDVASRSGKRVDLILSGEETELDRSVIEELSDPLVHILRNAVDHGIEPPEERRAAGKPETSTIHVTAWNQEAYIYISVRDDGRGIDIEAIRRKAIDRGLVPREVAEAASDEAVLEYIFFAGLSTAKQVSDVSGRGVGMDIVRNNIQRMNGQVKVESWRGQGSEFTIQLPLTLATTQALMVLARGITYAMPLVSVTEALTTDAAEIHSVAGRMTLRLRDELLPLVELAEALGDGCPPAAEAKQFVVAARHGDSQVAFLVDALLGEQDVVVKPLGDLIGNRRGLAGATILGDGTLGLIIDTAGLVSEPRRLVARA